MSGRLAFALAGWLAAVAMLWLALACAPFVGAWPGGCAADERWDAVRGCVDRCPEREEVWSRRFGECVPANGEGDAPWWEASRPGGAG